MLVLPWCLVALLAALTLAGSQAQAATPALDAARVLERHCVACHGPTVQNANVRLDSLSTDFVNDRRAVETWHDVRNALASGQMPPPGAPQLSDADRETVLVWLAREFRAAGEARRDASGVVVMRRLNRVEYQNTMRDLLGLDIDFVKNLPPDEVSRDGFTNNGSALGISALQMEHYLNAARSGLRRAIVEGSAPPVFQHRAEETVTDKLKNVNWSNRLGRTGTFVARIPDFPDEGEFVLRIRARAEIPEGAPYPRMHVDLGYRADTQTPSRTVAEIDVSNRDPRTFEFRGRIEEFPIQSRTQSKYPGMLVWIRNSFSDGQPSPLGRTVEVEVNGKTQKKMIWAVDPEFPVIVVEAIDFRAPAYSSWPPEHHTRLVPVRPRSERDELRVAKDVLRRFVRRAYRRPARPADLNPTVQFYRKVRPTVDSFEEALRETLAMVLISPDFLYRIEVSRGGEGRLSGHELATRLSYFLWGTMPDERLMGLADDGGLDDRDTLHSEALRMLAHPNSAAFVKQFSDQWLDLGGVERVAINPNYYPDFDPSLKADMRRETQQFFATVLRENLSALNFLRSDFTVINERMARHYGINGPKGGAFERVSLRDMGMPGGLLTQASTLLSNSTGEDSHPVERGVWIRKALLGDPPAPPPPAVPNLATGDPAAGLLPLKRQLELHQDNPACAHCHRDIDPWGIALEEFDAIGLRRDAVRRRSGEREELHPVDARATLPDGQTVDGVSALSRYLVDEQGSRFARALASKLLAYALGRSLERSDEGAVDEIASRFRQAGYRLRDLCTIIVTSDSFRSR